MAKLATSDGNQRTLSTNFCMTLVTNLSYILLINYAHVHRATNVQSLSVVGDGDDGVRMRGEFISDS